MCGEKQKKSEKVQLLEGSPPHVRGKAALLANPIVWLGITPACAGKSPNRLPVLHLSRDHPRMCGEKEGVKTMWLIDWGSPPHVRGKDIKGECAYVSGGITPACAGKR